MDGQSTHESRWFAVIHENLERKSQMEVRITKMVGQEYTVCAHPMGGANRKTGSTSEEISFFGQHTVLQLIIINMLRMRKSAQNSVYLVRLQKDRQTACGR